jgi:HAD superfamily hydrolase (TIGR01549 family)
VFSGIHTILFDLGATLVDYPIPSWPLAAGKCIEGVYGYLVRPESKLPPAAAVMPGATEAHLRRATPAADSPIQHRATLGLRRVVRSVSGRTLPRMAEACARMLVADGRAFDDALPTVRTLEERRYRLGLVSNTPWGTPEYLWENQLVRFGLAQHFKAACFSSAVGFRKPDPRIFRAVLDRLDAEPAKTLMVGDDLEADIVGAAQAGMRSALVRRHARSYSDPPLGTLSVLPDLRIASLEELLDHLPGPDQ